MGKGKPNLKYYAGQKGQKAEKKKKRAQKAEKKNKAANRAAQIKMKTKSPASLPPWLSSRNPSLSHEIGALAEYIRPRKKEKAVRAAAVECLRRVLKNLGEVSSFGSFGSQANVATFWSDVDLVIQPEGVEGEMMTHATPTKEVDATPPPEDTSFGSDSLFFLDRDGADNAEKDSMEASDSLHESSDSISLNLSASPTSSSPVPTSDQKKVRADALKSLKYASKQMRQLSWPMRVTVRKHAKVPIANFMSTFGVEFDLCISTVNGSDTTDYASRCAEKFGETFEAMVVVVKLILKEEGLDKPFTGGLGSFKVYVMVASLFEAHPSFNLGEMFLAMLRKYGKGGAEEFSTNTTLMAMGATIDCGGTFKAANVAKLFKKCEAIMKNRSACGSFFERMLSWGWQFVHERDYSMVQASRAMKDHEYLFEHGKKMKKPNDQGAGNVGGKFSHPRSGEGFKILEMPNKRRKVEGDTTGESSPLPRAPSDLDASETRAEELAMIRAYGSDAGSDFENEI